MDYKRFAARLESTAEALKADSRFETIIEIERGFDATEFSDLQDSIEDAGLEDVEIWSEFRQFHEHANGFLFQWLFKREDESSPLTGSAEIAGVQQIYLPEDAPPEDLKDFYGARRVLDRVSPDDEVAVRFSRGAKSPRLEYLSDATGKYHPLRLDFPTYLEALLECRALYRWQEFFVDDPDYPHDRAREESFFLSLQSLFPDADASIFRIPGGSRHE